MENEELLCPYKAEQYIAHIDSITPYFADVLSAHGTKMAPDEKIRAMINTVTLCDKDHCVVTNNA